MQGITRSIKTEGSFLRLGTMHCSVLLLRGDLRSEEHTSELQSHSDLVCRLLLEKKTSLGTRSARLPGRCRLGRSTRDAAAGLASPEQSVGRGRRIWTAPARRRPRPSEA